LWGAAARSLAADRSRVPAGTAAVPMFDIAPRLACRKLSFGSSACAAIGTVIANTPARASPVTRIPALLYRGNSSAKLKTV
jgi:hypothetical protein